MALHQHPSLIHLHAAQMRSFLTPSEAKLWSAINRKQLGVQFRSQVVIGSFIVDFLAPGLRLVVEIDGPYHARRLQADASRDRALRRLGYRVLRLSDELVERKLSLALELIREALAGSAAL